MIDTRDGDGRVPIDDCACGVARTGELLRRRGSAAGRLHARGLVARASTACSAREKDFCAACGHEVKIETRTPIDGRRRFRGELVAFDGGRAQIRVDWQADRDPLRRGVEGEPGLSLHQRRLRKEAPAVGRRRDDPAQARNRSDRQGQGHRLARSSSMRSKEAMVQAAHKKYGADKAIEPTYNEETGEVELFEFRTVVEVHHRSRDAGDRREGARTGSRKSRSATRSA